MAVQSAAVGGMRESMATDRADRTAGPERTGPTREGEVTTQEGGMSSHVRKHEQARREERLAQIEEQVREGKLVIRPMTEAEKKKWGVK